MNPDQVRKLEIYYPTDVYEALEASTKLNYGNMTLKTLSMREPERAFPLFLRIVQNNSYQPSYIRVETETGEINSEQDGMFAAKADFIYSLNNTLAGGRIIQPVNLAIGALITTFRILRKPIETHVPQIFINLEPPSLV